MMDTKETYFDNKKSIEEDTAYKKALIMALGNARDLNGLLRLLEEETTEEVLFSIINVLGALGDSSAIYNLHQFINSEISIKLYNQAKIAIDVINSKNDY